MINKQILLQCLLLCMTLGPISDSYGQIRSASGKKISFTTLDEIITHQMDSLKIPGASVAVIYNGNIVYERSFGFANIDSQKRVNKNTIFEAASLSKPVFAYFVMKIKQDGILNFNLDQPVYEYYPYPDIAYDDRYKLITPRMLLTHTSGFPNWRDNNKLTIQFTPGTAYSYSGEGYEYLVNAIATLTHTNSKSLDSLLLEVLAKPLGIEHFGFTRTDYLTAHKAYGYYSGKNPDNGKFKPVSIWFGAAHSLHTDAHNYAKFLAGIMQNKGLKKDYVDSLLQPRVNVILDGKPSEYYYGFGFNMDSTKYGVRYQHTGNNGNFTGGFMFFRQRKSGFVVLTNGDKGIWLHIRLTELLTEGK